MTQYQSTALSLGIVDAGFHYGQFNEGVAKAPDDLRGAGLLAVLPPGTASYRCRAEPDTDAGGPTGRAGTDRVHCMAEVSSSTHSVFRAASAAAARSSRLLVLGGDHSVSIGSIAAVATLLPQVAVLWVDAHADVNTVAGTASGKLHGCPVSFLLGMEESIGAGIGTGFEWFRKALREHGRAAFLAPSQIAYVGLRSVDPPEQAILQEQGIYTAYMCDVREKGLDRCLDDILGSVFAPNCPIHISFDVDGIDPEFAPSTGTPVPGGLSLSEAVRIVQRIRRSGRLFSMDLVEVNTEIGSVEDAGTTLRSAIEIAKAAFGDGQ